MATNKTTASTSVPNLKHKNLCGIKKAVTELYDRLNTLIGIDDSTPEIIDNISEAIKGVEDLKTWQDKVKGLTLTHINHNSTVTGDDYDTFVANADGVKMHYDCFSLSSGGGTSHDNIAFPVASDTQAGIISAETYRKLMVLLADVEDPNPPAEEEPPANP